MICLMSNLISHLVKAYRDKVDEIYAKLLSFKICREDDGALVVFHPEHKRFAKQPLL